MADMRSEAERRRENRATTQNGAVAQTRAAAQGGAAARNETAAQTRAAARTKTPPRLISMALSLWRSPPPLLRQIFRFGIAGSLSFVIDYGLFIILLRVFDIHYFAAAAISFILSAVFNWAINAYWVFDSAKISRKSIEIILFISIAAIGLGINELTLWVGVELLSVSAEVSKLVATVVVAVWNFVIRKLLLYR